MTAIKELEEIRLILLTDCDGFHQVQMIHSQINEYCDNIREELEINEILKSHLQIEKVDDSVFEKIMAITLNPKSEYMPYAFCNFHLKPETEVETNGMKDFLTIKTWLEDKSK